VIAGALTGLTAVMLALVVLMAMRLSLHGHEEVLAILCNSMNQALISIWPFTLELLLLVILGKGFFRHIRVEENGMCGFERGFSRIECAFDLGSAIAANAVRIVVDRGLQNCTIINVCQKR
jgi:hypothetical protein